MTITLPDHPALTELTPATLQLDLACALFAAGRASSRASAEIAGLDYDEFLDALRERRIPRYTIEMLREDIISLNRVFPGDPLPLPGC